MPASRDRPTARRPALARPGRRALSHVGGEVTMRGDPAWCEVLSRAFAVRTAERDATLTHPFHAYPARLHPEVARALVAFEPAGTILDPCCGSGTVLVEAVAHGARAIGTDLSPLALALSRVKTRRTTNAERKAIVERAHTLSRLADEALQEWERFSAPPGEEIWFMPRMLREVSALRAGIAARPDGFERDALWMLFSSVLVKVSRQRSDTDAQQVDKAMPPGTALHLFARKSFELVKGLAALASAMPKGTPPADVHLDDATQLRTVPDGSVDRIITSPPYANTYDYVTHHERRYAWLGLDASVLATHEIGAARWFHDPRNGIDRFARDLAACCAAMGRVLRPGGMAFVIIADGSVGDTPLPADDAIEVAVWGTPLEVAAVVSQPRPVFDTVSRRAFRERAKHEHLVALVRPR